MPEEHPRPRDTASDRDVTAPRRHTTRLAEQRAVIDATPIATPVAATPSPSYAQVMRPKLLTIRSRLLRSETAGAGWRWGLVSAIGLLFWVLALVLGVRVLTYLRATPEIGTLIAGKTLGLAFISFFMILLLSNIITALSTFFLARDLDLLISSPVDPLTLYLGKLTESLGHSSWMVSMMAFPIFGAYGYVYGGGWGFVLIALAVWVPFMIIPAVLGAATTNLLVNAFPARRTRDILSVVAVLSAAGLVVLFRLMRPEKLARPEGVRSLVDFIALLRTPSSPYLPSEWAARGVMSWLGGVFDPLPILLLWSTAAAALVFGVVVHHRLYPVGFTKAQESAQRWVRGQELRSWLEQWLHPLGVLRRELILKELRVFFRDTTQWSQLILIAVLVVVYVLNVKLLPISGSGMSFYLVNAIPLLNLGLAGFVLASIAARFIFPAVSMEGRTLWLLRSSPLPMRQLLWVKFWTGTIPLLGLAVAIVGVTDLLLQVSPFIFAVSLVTIAMLTFALAGLALGLGTVFPQYETENAAQIPTSFGGLVYMILAIALVGAVVVLEARPVFSYLSAKAFGSPVDGGEMALHFGLAAVLGVVATIVPLVVAGRRLEATDL